MLAAGTNPYQQRPAPPPGKMYTQARQPSQQPVQQQQPAPQPKPKAAGIDMSAYKPGAAQPVQQQSYGTAYGQQSSSAQPTAVYWKSQEGQAAAKYAADYHSTYGRLPDGFTQGANPPPPTSQWQQRDFSAEAKLAADHYSRFGELPPETPIYRGGSAASGGRLMPYGIGSRADVLARKEALDAGSRRTEVYGDPRGGYAGMPPQYRPPPAQMEPAQTPWGPSMDPFADQRAIIDRLNQQRADRQVNFNQTWDNPNQGWGNDSYGLDFNIARRDAGLGNGSPSMSPDYGQSFVGNFNQQFGGGIRHWSDPSNPRGANYTPQPTPRTPTQDELSYYDLSQRVGGKQAPNPFFEPAPLPPQPNAPRGAGKAKDNVYMGGGQWSQYAPGQAQPIQAPSQGDPYQSLVDAYESGAPLNNPVWEQRRNMGYGAPDRMMWQGQQDVNPTRKQRPEPAKPAPKTQRQQESRVQHEKLMKQYAAQSADMERRARYQKPVKYDRFGRIVGRERRGQ